MTEAKSTTKTDSTKHETLAAALAAFQAELPSIKKGNTASAGTYSYSYADLADISPLVLPLLGKHGLAWTCRPTLADTGFALYYQLLHGDSQDSLEGIYPLPAATTPAQQLGSAITYARRYALCAVTGIAPGGDDDDAASAPVAAPRQQKQAPRPSAPTRDWAKEAAAITSLERLTILANEAQDGGELGLRQGEETVFDILQARKRTLESPEPLVGGGTTAKARQWVAEAEALKFSEDVKQLRQEAEALKASPKVLADLAELIGRKPVRPVAAAEGEPWAPVADDKGQEEPEAAEPVSEGQAAVLADDAPDPSELV